jgi:SAM-dependent methyltransferase
MAPVLRLFKYVTLAIVTPIGFWKYLKDLIRFRTLSTKACRSFPLRLRDQIPHLSDRTNTTGFDRHYIYHTAWAARVLAQTKPVEHVDIASSLYFVTTASAFVPIRFYDYRPANLELTNVSSDRADLLALPFADNAIASLSCMHVIEHVGLGRYGDALNPLGDLQAIAELKRVLAVEGTLLFVVPVGKPRVCFNAHRIYSFEMVRTAFADFELVQFSLIPDHGNHKGLIVNANPALVADQTYGCGCFWFRKANRDT